MSLPIEQLLMLPRYMVIALWPFDCNYEIGHVLTLEYDAFYEDYVYKHDPFITKGKLDLYPHLFRAMAWYEGRKVEELPKYLKLTLTHGTRFFNIEPSNYLDKEFMKWKFGGHTLKDFQPTTAEEYISHINKTK